MTAAAGESMLRQTICRQACWARDVPLLEGCLQAGQDWPASLPRQVWAYPWAMLLVPVHHGRK